VKEFTAREKCGPGTRTVKEDRYAGCSGRDLLDSGNCTLEMPESGYVAARALQAGDDTDRTGSDISTKTIGIELVIC
jgi:hypothetical protein